MSRWQFVAGCSVLLLASGAVAGQEPKAKKVEVRNIDLSAVKLNARQAETGRLERPIIITDAVGLGEAFPDKASQAAIAKQVDFTKDKLVFFLWAGSGGDRLMPRVADGVVELVYRGGVTDDLRRHFHLFALPRDATWRLQK